MNNQNLGMPEEKPNFSQRLKNVWQRIVLFFRRKKDTSTKIKTGEGLKNWKIIFVVILVVILFIFFTCSIVFAIGMYRYDWSGKSAKIAMKTLPYPAAIVGLDIVTMNEFYQELSYVEHFYEKTGQQPPEESVLKKQILDQLIERNILEHQARRYNIAVSGSEVDEEFQKIADENGGAEEVEKILTELYGLSINNFKILIRAQLLKEKLRDEIPVQRKAKHILLKWTSKDGSKKRKAQVARLERIKSAIKKGKTTFEKMAKRYSQDVATKNKGGDLGWVQRGQMVEEFEKALFELKKDEISDIVKTKFGYHLIKVEDIKGKIDMSFVDWIEEITKNTKTWRLVK